VYFQLVFLVLLLLQLMPPALYCRLLWRRTKILLWLLGQIFSRFVQFWRVILWWRRLLFRTVVDWLMRMWLVLRFGWSFVVESNESLFDVPYGMDTCSSLFT
jgi:hypothetical protein